jgi:hypothetical protein
VNRPKLTILAADTDAACDPETGTCAIPQTPIPSPGAAPRCQSAPTACVRRRDGRGRPLRRGRDQEVNGLNGVARFRSKDQMLFIERTVATARSDH